MVEYLDLPTPTAWEKNVADRWYLDASAEACFAAAPCWYVGTLRVRWAIHRSAGPFFQVEEVAGGFF